MNKENWIENIIQSGRSIEHTAINASLIHQINLSFDNLSEEIISKFSLKLSLACAILIISVNGLIAYNNSDVLPESNNYELISNFNFYE